MIRNFPVRPNLSSGGIAAKCGESGRDNNAIGGAEAARVAAACRRA